jgi:hypothetical protein
MMRRTHRRRLSETALLRLRLGGFGLAACVLFSVLAAQLWRLQVAHGEQYHEQAELNRLRGNCEWPGCLQSERAPLRNVLLPSGSARRPRGERNGAIPAQPILASRWRDPDALATARRGAATFKFGAWDGEQALLIEERQAAAGVLREGSATT